jgi:DNA-binding response OmpR family regulator
MTPNSGRILVIDDSWVILEQIKLALNAHGYEVRTTTGIDVATRLIPNIDLAVVDFHMPGMNGSEVVSALRKSARDASTCLFYLYTSDRDEAARYASHGFDGAFLRKGESEALAAQVDAVFRTVRMRQLAQRMRSQRLQSS